jgi:hypothetical protein
MTFVAFSILAIAIIIVSATAAEPAIRHLSQKIFGRDVHLPRTFIYYLGGFVGLLSGYALVADLLNLPKLPSFRGQTEQPVRGPRVPEPESPTGPVQPPIVISPSAPEANLEPQVVAPRQLPTPPTRPDIFEQTIARNSTPTTLRVKVFKNEQVRIDYLCNGGHPWWAYKLADESYTWASIILTGLSKYNSYDAGGQGHGQGVFFGADLGPLTEYPERPRPDQLFTPLPVASIAIKVRKENFEGMIPVGRLPEPVIEQLARCTNLSFPRVLHRKPTIRY